LTISKLLKASKGPETSEIDARDGEGVTRAKGRREMHSKREENLRKKSELIGSESRGQTILEAAVI